MALSNIATERREKEEEALRFFIGYSLIGSIAFHLVILFFSNFALGLKMPEIAEEPMEVIVVDEPKLEPLDEKEPEKDSKPDNSKILTSSSTAEDADATIATRPSGDVQTATQTLVTPPFPKIVIPNAIAPSRSTISQPKPVTPSAKDTAPQPPQTKPAATQPSQPIQTGNLRTATKEPTLQESTVVTKPTQTERSSSKPQIGPNPSNNSQSSSDSRVATRSETPVARGTQTGMRSSNNTQNSSNSGGTTGSSNTESRGTQIGNGDRNSSGDIGGTTGSGNTEGRGTQIAANPGNNSRSTTSTADSGEKPVTTTRTSETTTPKQQIATAPTSPTFYRERTESSDRNRERPSSNTGSSRVRCRNCDKPEYSRSARQRGAQGRAQVSVDIDNRGNVTGVRLANSTGDRELDEAAIRAARNWKFDSAARRRQGIRASVDFQLEGSEGSRRSRERRRSQENVARNSDEAPRKRRRLAETSIASSSEVTPRRRRRLAETSVASNSESSPRRRQRVEASRSESTPRRRRRLETASMRSPEVTSRRRQRVEASNSEATPRRQRRLDTPSARSSQPTARRRRLDAAPAASSQSAPRARRRQAAPASEPASAPSNGN
jgi:TonB family protein